jgi:hypothetical protein
MLLNYKPKGHRDVKRLKTRRQRNSLEGGTKKSEGLFLEKVKKRSLKFIAKTLFFFQVGPEVPLAHSFKCTSTYIHLWNLVLTGQRVTCLKHFVFIF